MNFTMERWQQIGNARVSDQPPMRLSEWVSHRFAYSILQRPQALQVTGERKREEGPWTRWDGGGEAMEGRRGGREETGER